MKLRNEHTKMKFVNLHAHSNASLGDAINLPEEHFNFVIENAGDDSMAMALSDHGNCNGFVYAHLAKQKLRKKGIPFKAIWACELYLHPDLDEWLKLKQQKEEEKESQGLVVEVEKDSKDKFYDPIKRRHHLVCIAQNQEGLKNLYRIVTNSYRKGFYRFPRTDFKTLEKYNKGLMISHACTAGLGAWLIFRDHEKGEAEVINSLNKEFKPLLDIFGPQRAFLEYQFNKMPEQRLVNSYFEKYSKISGYNIIATADSHFARPEWWREREIYRLLSQQSKGYDVSAADLPKSIDELKCELYPKNGDQMFAAYKAYNPELDEKIVLDSIERTFKIAHEQIEDIDFDKTYKLPTSLWKGKDEFHELMTLCNDGLQAKGLDENEAYINRLARELTIIKQKGLCSYFLTIKKAIDAVKKEQLINCGRGSGCGSLVNYVLGITLIDPIRNELPFERFISEARSEPADIDTDTEDRDKTLEILRREFGEDNVLAISNFNTLQLKSLIKDVSKFYGIPFEEVNKVTTVAEKEARQAILTSVGNDQKLYVFDLDGAMEHSPTFRAFMEKYPSLRESVKVLFRQGKSIGRHAGGVLLTEDAESNMPIIRIRGTDQTPWGEGITAKHLEPLGFIKYDFLSLATLRTVRRAIERILTSTGKEPAFENVVQFYNEHLHPDIVLDGEKEVFEEIYHKGRYCGIFQFTMENVQKFCSAARPEKVSDIAAITALWRPGALSNDGDDKYLENKNNPELIDWKHPILKEVLGPTWNVLIYQEQFMSLANKLAGFNLTEADELRKLLMKPITSLADEFKKKRIEAGKQFIEGCVANGLNKQDAHDLWHKDIMSYISYGFSSNHAIPYAYLSYQCAYLLHHFPNEFIPAYLECDPDINNALKEASAVGYTIAPVDIIHSTTEWRVDVDTRTLYPPLSAIKGLGDVATEELLLRRSWWRETLSSREMAPNEKEVWDLFFFDQELVQLKKTSKLKKVWHFSKFNKRNLEMLCKTESLNGLNIIGKEKMFKNHAHFWNCLSAIWSNKEKIDIDHESRIVSSQDWTNKEKIEFQYEILGTVPFELVLTRDEVDEIEGVDIMNLSYLTDEVFSGEPQLYWFVITGWEEKKTGGGKRYWKLNLSNLKETNLQFNYFHWPPKEGWEKFGVYCAKLMQDGQYINCKGFVDRLK